MAAAYSYYILIPGKGSLAGPHELQVGRKSGRGNRGSTFNLEAVGLGSQVTVMGGDVRRASRRDMENEYTK
ncbi:hypothetical protein NM688_g5855 [Phlebia brevispora]|uniref:Uncharacterized protein n=1 Tax=Phlebia brevispora TaxID=194682 RepID=A0ACC1SNJ8_9APHY|nr:hypothetical protein NM688_g5855 [Phlebia brevispora]